MRLVTLSRSTRVLWLPIAGLCCFAQFQGGGGFGGGEGATDPGVQQGNRGTGAALVTPANDPGGYVAFFQDGLARFQAVDAVANGLGPRFNSNSSGSCHAHPAPGGSGAAV